MISKAEFQEWQSHPVTKAFYEAMSETRADALEKLAHNIPQEIDDDFFKGYIHAVDTITLFDLEEVE